MLTIIKLTKTQEKELSKVKQNNPSEMIRDRAHAILLRNHGQTIKNIAEALLRSNDFVVRAIHKFNKGELEQTALTGHNYKLASASRDRLIDLIKNCAPGELKGFGFKNQSWTTAILRLVIKSQYGVVYKTEKSYYDLFAAAGFSFHKTKDFRQDSTKMKESKKLISNRDSVALADKKNGSFKSPGLPSVRPTPLLKGS